MMGGVAQGYLAVEHAMRFEQSPPEIIAGLVEWGAAQRSVRGMVLTSTRAIAAAPRDQLSDYDVILIVEELAPWVTERSWLDDFGEVLVVYWDPVYADPIHGVDRCANVTQYADGLKLDFTLWPVELFREIVDAPELQPELDAGYQVLLDKDGLTAGLPAPTHTAYIPRPPTEEAFQLLVNDFLSDAPYAAKCLWRGELFPLKWCLDYDMKHVYLRPLLEWRLAIGNGWSAPVGSLGKGLRQKLPAELWARVERCYAGAGLAENWEALEQTLEVFRSVAREVAAHLGYRYPDDLHERVVAYVDRMRRAERPQRPDRARDASSGEQDG
jgi:aminoglycoside 6-adenylyltransferase